MFGGLFVYGLYVSDVDLFYLYLWNSIHLL